MYQQKSQSQQKQLLTRWSRCSWTTAMVLVAVATHIDANERGLRPHALTPMCAFFLLSFPPFYRKRKKKKRQKTNPAWIFLGETQPTSITKRKGKGKGALTRVPNATTTLFLRVMIKSFLSIAPVRWCESAVAI